MNETIDDILSKLADEGNLRSIPDDSSALQLIDLSSNDYLGLGEDEELRRQFFDTIEADTLAMSASASRLLARRQKSYSDFEGLLQQCYPGRKALIFNSGYHANTGLVSALADRSTVILADKLVHASIIDGIKLSGARFERFRHNDMSHLDRLAAKAAAGGSKILIIAESVYSMDGDRADIDALADIKRRYPGALLYVDEAHAVGVEGPAGLGLCAATKSADDVDIVIGTLGKALASVGAYAIVSPAIREFAVNRARSFIFSTALPPINIEWSRHIFARSLEMDSRRLHLRRLSTLLADALAAIGAKTTVSHIQPLIIGNPADAVAASKALRQEGFAVLPIRTPTVPPGTDRLRFSLSAALKTEQIERLKIALQSIMQ